MESVNLIPAKFNSAQDEVPLRRHEPELEVSHDEGSDASSVPLQKIQVRQDDFESLRQHYGMWKGWGKGGI